MFQKLLRKGYFILRLELLSMQVQKCGKINLMIKNQISGVWDV